MCVAFLGFSGFAQQRSKDFCDAAIGGTSYSNAYIDEETSDALGYALVLKSRNNAVLYVYEGGEPSVIKLPFERSGNRITIRGIWHEHLVEYPARKEIVEDHPVVVEASLTGRVMNASIRIGDWGESKIKMKKVAHILGCVDKN